MRFYTVLPSGTETYELILSGLIMESAMEIAFLRHDLSARNIISCAEAMSARDGRCFYTVCLGVAHQKPVAAKGLIFVAIEDETGPTNIVV